VGDAALNRVRRQRDLDFLDSARSPVDVLVIGGGVIGAGVALDAATRGLSVVLAERHDLAFGTSRWSSKLVHGGLRYLATGHLGVARESAAERHILFRHTAPHLVRPLPQVVPLLPGTGPARTALLRGGFLAGDLLRSLAGTSAQTLPRSRRISRAETERYLPAVRSHDLRGGLLSWDGQLEDDARLVVSIARTAAFYGARVITRCGATEVTGQGVVLTDALTGRSYDVPARVVVNATGVWAREVAPGVNLRPSRGTHLVVGAEALANPTAGLTVPVPGQASRFVFALPVADERVLIGLTDVEAPGEIPDVPVAAPEEIDFLLDTVNSALSRPLTRDDVRGSFSGLRPLLDDGHGETSDISRRHAIIIAADGLVTVVGGKLTTYRRVAQDALDAALERIARTGPTAGPCRTGRLPLVGADRPAGDRAAGDRAAGEHKMPYRLLRRYGSEAALVIGESNGDPRLLEPIAPGLSTTMAELLFGLRHEGALTVDDLLERRTRIAVVAPDRALATPAAEAALAAM
jgi:glycerol-3-phosphate dehydrogenase